MYLIVRNLFPGVLSTEWTENDQSLFPKLNEIIIYYSSSRNELMFHFLMLFSWIAQFFRTHSLWSWILRWYQCNELSLMKKCENDTFFVPVLSDGIHRNAVLTEDSNCWIRCKPEYNELKTSSCQRIFQVIETKLCRKSSHFYYCWSYRFGSNQSWHSIRLFHQHTTAIHPYSTIS